MGKITWLDHVGNEKVFQRVMDENNILQTVKRRKANWIGHILLRNYFLKHVTEGKTEGKKVTARLGRRRKQLLEDLREKRKYCKPKEKALDRTLRRTLLRRGSEPVVRQTTECMNTRNLCFIYLFMLQFINSLVVG